LQSAVGGKETVGEEVVGCCDFSAPVEYGVAEKTGRCAGALRVRAATGGVLATGRRGKGREGRYAKERTEGCCEEEFFAEGDIRVVAAEGNQVAKVLSSWSVILVDVIVDSKGAEDGYEPFSIVRRRRSPTTCVVVDVEAVEPA